MVDASILDWSADMILKKIYLLIMKPEWDVRDSLQLLD